MARGTDRSVREVEIIDLEHRGLSRRTDRVPGLGDLVVHSSLLIENTEIAELCGVEVTTCRDVEAVGIQRDLNVVPAILQGTVSELVQRLRDLDLVRIAILSGRADLKFKHGRSKICNHHIRSK